MFNIKVIIYEIHFNIISCKEERIQKKRYTLDLIEKNIEETIYIGCWTQLARA
jgi:hypothetical protein